MQKASMNGHLLAAMIPDVLIITGSGPRLGSGHLKRMQVLNNILKDNRINTQLVNWAGNQKLNLNSYQKKTRVVVLDRRDTRISDLNLQKKSEHTFILIDNRNEDRKKTGVVFDTLPHFEMPDEEFNRSLDNFLLNPVYENYQARPAPVPVFTDVKYVDNDLILYSKIDKLMNPVFHNRVFCLPHPTLKFRLNLSAEDLAKKITGSSFIITYFGQTLFEALYLGKPVAIYSISPYHTKLSRFFIDKYNSLSLNTRPIKANGYKNLIALIKENL